MNEGVGSFLVRISFYMHDYPPPPELSVNSIYVPVVLAVTFDIRHSRCEITAFMRRILLIVRSIVALSFYLNFFRTLRPQNSVRDRHRGEKTA